MNRGLVKCFIAAAALLFSGCSAQEAQPVAIEREAYEKEGYQTAEVQTGDLTPVITLTLKTDGYERIAYDMDNEDLQLDKVYVAVGDQVEAGDVLVSFESESIQQTIESYREQCSQNELLAEHYENLMKLDDSLDYSSNIEMLQQDITVAKLYIEEARARLAGYQIVAKKSGTIIEISDYLKNGYYMLGSNQIIQACGSGRYTASRPEDYDFAVGDIYSADAGVASYELKVAEVGEDQVIFEPVSDMSALSESDTLTMEIEKPVLHDVVYVETAAVHKGDDGSFVYVLDENGYRDVVWVEIGDLVGDYYVINAGLSGGEKVSVG